jgi:transcriptional regulator with XRE-family HTH domain
MLGPKVRQLRKNHGLTQAELAKEIGVDASYIGHIESGRTREPSRQIIGSLAHALHVPVEELLEAAGYLPAKPKRPLTDESKEDQFETRFVRLSPAKKRLAKKMIDDLLRTLEESDIEG